MKGFFDERYDLFILNQLSVGFEISLKYKVKKNKLLMG